jgi:SAM-dependent methyltransferase
MLSLSPAVTSTPDPPFIDPPFQLNAAETAQYAPELTGYRMLATMARRLGWPSVSGKRVLDFGCGVRFARTINNLNLDIGLYAGVDVNREAISWLQDHLTDQRFLFRRINDESPMYNPDGIEAGDYAAVETFAGLDLDAACMFSVITHQRPHEARRIFALLRKILGVGRQLYFTALMLDGIVEYAEGAEEVGLMSVYNPDYLAGLVTEAGFAIDHLYPPTEFQQHAFVCHAV